MSYTVQPPVVAPPPAVAPGPRRPVPVTLASAVLELMALVGLAYAIAAVSTAPGTVDRFRAASAGAASADVDGYVSVIWIGAAIGTVLAVILVALYLVLALGLRRGSNAARIATWVVCGLGLLAGCGSTATVLVERSGTGDPQSLGAALSGAYPSSWIGLNLSLAIAQMVGYAVVALLLIAGRGAWFGRGPAVPAAQVGAQPGYGASGYGAPGYGTPGYGTPGYGAPTYDPSTGAIGYGAPAPGYPAGAPGYAAPGDTSGYAPPPGYAAPGTGAPGYAAPGSGAPGSGAPGYGPPGAPAAGYGAPQPGYSYGAPYDQSPPQPSGQGAPTAADRAYQPGNAQDWAPPPSPEPQSAPAPGQSPGDAAPQQPGEPSGMPPAQSGQNAEKPAADPSGRPEQGPDHEYWSRPSS